MKTKKRVKRKIIQVAVATAIDEGCERKRLYALDSTGQIWFWTNGTHKESAGWCAMDLPWEHPSKMYPPEPKTNPVSPMSFKTRLKAFAGNATPVSPGDKLPPF